MTRRPLPRSLVVAAIAVGCDRPAPVEHGSPQSRASSSAGAIAAPRESADAKSLAPLRESAVTSRSYARRTLWSWTTREQAETLRANKVLLLPTELPSGPTPYVSRLEEVAAGAGVHAEVARALLLHPSLRLRRYAWSRPWPTRRGLADRDYGDQLVRVVLAPDALVARFDPDRPDVFEVQDLDGRAIPVSEILGDPSRLAAILHWRTGPETPIAHREYVLCNESKIAEWSLATPEVRAAIAEDRATIAAFRPARPWKAAVGHASASWEGPDDDADGLFAKSLAFDNDRYLPSPENLRAIDDALARADQVGPPLVVTPSARFAEGAVVPNVRLRRPAARVRTVV
jgi:hypothetical protein